MFKRALVPAILLVLILAGGWLRFSDLSTESYWMDEGYTVNAVQAIVAKGESILDSGEPYFCPLYCYPTALIVKTLGESPASYRLLSALAGLLLIFATYLVGSRFFSRPAGLLAAFFTTFSYWQVAWSRQARWYTLFALFFWLALYFFHQFLDERKSRREKIIYGGLSTLFTLLALLTHGLGFILPFFLLAWYGGEKIFKAGRGKRGDTIKMVLAVVAGAVGLFFLIEVFIRPGLSSALFTNISWFNLFPYYAHFYLREYWFFLPLIALTLTAGGLGHRRLLLPLLFFVYLLPLSFLTDLLHYRYLFHLTPIFFILAAAGSVAAYDKLKRRAVKIGFIFLVVVAFFLSGAGLISPQPFYALEADDPAATGGFFSDRTYFAYTPQPDWAAAYRFIARHRKPGTLVISTQPQFNKIYLGEAGFWLKIPYLGWNRPAGRIINDREYYVGARVVDDLPELKSLTKENTGFIIFDYMAADGRLPAKTLDYIENNFELVFEQKTNSYSEVWVYRF